MTKIDKNRIPPIPFFRIFSDVKFFGGILFNTIYLHNKNIMRYFAAFMQGTSIMSFVGAAFFIATSLGYLSDGCRAEKTIIVPCRTEKVAFSFLNTLSFSFMQGTTKTASKANNSNFTSTPTGAKTGRTITLTLTGVRKSTKLFGSFKKLRNFADDLTNGKVNQSVFIAVAFFMPIYHSIGCCFSSGSRCKALLTLPKVREQQSFFYFKHF